VLSPLCGACRTTNTVITTPASTKMRRHDATATAHIGGRFARMIREGVIFGASGCAMGAKALPGGGGNAAGAYGDDWNPPLPPKFGGGP
jgi:uncharacterized membrane protein